MSVDGADAVDNSVNGVRATVSQEGGAGISGDHQQLHAGIRARDGWRGEYRDEIGIKFKSTANLFGLLARQRHSGAGSVFRDGALRTGHTYVRDELR